MKIDLIFNSGRSAAKQLDQLSDGVNQLQEFVTAAQVKKAMAVAAKQGGKR